VGRCRRPAVVSRKFRSATEATRWGTSLFLLSRRRTRRVLRRTVMPDGHLTAGQTELIRGNTVGKYWNTLKYVSGDGDCSTVCARAPTGSRSPVGASGQWLFRAESEVGTFRRL